jgi:hypothetical protein
MQPEPRTPIDDEQANWMMQGVSILVGSRDARHRPHLMRAIGCRVDADRRRVTVLMPRGRSGSVLADLAENRQVAVVFSEPATNRTLQLKGSDATLTDAVPDDESLAQRYLADFSGHIVQLGMPAEVAQSILGDDGGLVAVQFGIDAAFEQTPGPSAGRRLQP